ncbi:L-2-hydroxyglutarate oxidase [Cylindrospermopsis raciborskii MVCC19]|nr:L-2-hydroxyglutarate oxidase [Cylindrospermopsis raciborskii]NLQ05618.1 L-2-hydroxyglutarate oxidase [Cylindrospermopsis raciborskii MVCC19]OHY34226.1 hydroxyglutarate oxidase [Cylindrospermopsis raciborskii MVCC14]
MCDVLVVGGGIVGLATALRILQSRPQLRLVLLEKESHLACHQTGRNSGVIHSGLYYRPGSLKARNCRAGYDQLVAFCREEGIAHDICGKVVVATSTEELSPLATLYDRGVANGLTGLRWLSSEEIKEVEPYCVGLRGLRVPQTGIVDYKAVALKYAEKLRDGGAEIILGSKVEHVLTQDSSVEVVTADRIWQAKFLVVCGGLQSDRLALKTEPDLPLRIIPFRGEYYELKSEVHHLVRHLIYPVPNPAFPFLGVHFTRMIGGGVECGPNAVLAWGRECYKKSDFNVRDVWETVTWGGFHKVAIRYWRSGLDEMYRSWSKAAFVRALQKLIPSIQGEDLVSGGVGIRAQACHINGQLLDDFELRSHGRVIHVCNAPSPAATASLAIGQTIAQEVLSRLS